MNFQLQEYQEIIDLIAIVGVIATFIGLIATLIGLIYAFRQARKSSEQARKSSEEYKAALEISEKYQKLVQEYKGRILGWEGLIQELANQIDSESEAIWLAMDTLGYGSISRPEAFRGLWSKLVGKAISAEASIRIVTFDDDALHKMSVKQFGEEVQDHADKIQEGMDNQHKCIKYLLHLGSDSVTISLTSYFPLHLFIFKSNGVAFFALQEVLQGTVKVHAIKTSDPALVEICSQSFLDMERFTSKFVVPNSAEEHSEIRTNNE